MDLHALAQPFEFLLGTWRGTGRGNFPTIEPFQYSETITFTAVPGKPFFRYEQSTASPEGTPMHTELGFLRFVGDLDIELVLAQPSGQSEMLTGTLIDARILALTSTQVLNSPTAKTVDATQRRFTLSEDGLSLTTEFSMAAVGEQMQRHLLSVVSRA